MKTYTIFSFLRELLKSLLTPLPILWLFLIAACVLYLTGKKRIAKWVFGLSIIWFFLISTPFLPKKLLTHLENQYQPVQLPIGSGDPTSAKDSIVNILVLGSGYDTDDRLSYTSQLNPSGLARLAEGIRMQRLIPNSKLIFSGYAGSQPLTTAEANSFAAQELGVDSTIISIICEPWNTKAEAQEYLRRFGTNYHLYLVTKAAHMPRAAMLFREAGLNPTPSPTDFNIKKNNIPSSYKDYFPSSKNIRWMEIVFNEYLGMLWAQMGGN